MKFTSLAKNAWRLDVAATMLNTPHESFWGTGVKQSPSFQGHWALQT
jgi:hypothetical protein